MESKEFNQEEKDNIINRLHLNSEESSSDNEENLCDCCEIYSSSEESDDEVNVLSIQEQFILATIDAIKDPKEKIEQLIKYLNLLKNPKEKN